MKVEPHRSRDMSGTSQQARERAAENSRGRKPGVTLAIENASPFRGDRYRAACASKRERVRVGTRLLAQAVLCQLCRPLRGLTSLFCDLIPGLTPGARLCRRLRRLVEQSV